MTDRRQEHLGALSRDFAVFLPAISNFYNTFISKQRVTEGAHIPKERIPQGFENGVEGLNFLILKKACSHIPQHCIRQDTPVWTWRKSMTETTWW
jgi:hypothetical protein